MPVLRHAKKKLRQDKVRAVRNKKIKDAYKKLVKEANIKKTAEALSRAFSGVDIAAKEHIIPKNKAARMKSALSKAIAGPAKTAASAVEKAETTVKKAVKPAVKKATKKSTAKKK